MFRMPIRSHSCASLHSEAIVPLVLAFLLALFPTVSPAQNSAAKNMDVIVLNDGNQLSGKLVGVANGKATFHSDSLGDVTIGLDKIKSIHAAGTYAVIQQGKRLSRKTPVSSIPQGKIDIEQKQVKIAGQGTTRSLPEDQTQYIVDEPSFEKAFSGYHGWRSGWSGTLTAGASLVQATQNSRSFNAGADALRTVPGADWMAPSYRTSLDLSATYGSVSSPNLPTVKTNIIHGGLEQDWFLSPRLFTLALASWDHNFSQGLALQQIYGAGLGYTLIKDPIQELDLKADLHFERQTFSAAPGVAPPVVSPARNLVGMDFGDTYMRKLAHGIVGNQTLMITPAFNQPKAFSALATASLLFPVYKGFSFHVGAQDAFLNAPGFGSKKNSFQFTAGVGYSFK